jgi:hypothetical protein
MKENDESYKWKPETISVYQRMKVHYESSLELI